MEDTSGRSGSCVYPSSGISNRMIDSAGGGKGGLEARTLRHELSLTGEHRVSGSGRVVINVYSIDVATVTHTDTQIDSSETINIK